MNLNLEEKRALKKSIFLSLEKLGLGDGHEDAEKVNDKAEAEAIERDNILNNVAPPPSGGIDSGSLQNRDRSRQASVLQMKAIAANPDYGIASISRTAESGAPMVFLRSTKIPSQQAGKSEIITMSDGKGGKKKVKTVYAVVEASSVVASHDIDGNKAEKYGTGTGIMALNNGRSIALSHAYKQGSADGYREELENDFTGHGIAIAAIQKLKEPVLVRIFNEEDLSDISDAGAASNTTGTIALSASEQAKTDAGRISGHTLTSFKGGSINSQENAEFVRAFIDDLGAGADVAGMLKKDGRLSSDGVKRIESAMVSRALGNESIVTDLSENEDTELKSLGSAIKSIGAPWSYLRMLADKKQINPAMDITDNLNEALTLVMKSRRENVSVTELMNQEDIFSGSVSPITQQIIKIIFKNDGLGRARSEASIKRAIIGFIGDAKNTLNQVDLLGNQVDALSILAKQGELLAKEEAATSNGLLDSATLTKEERLEEEKTYLFLGTLMAEIEYETALLRAGGTYDSAGTIASNLSNEFLEEEKSYLFLGSLMANIEYETALLKIDSEYPA